MKKKFTTTLDDKIIEDIKIQASKEKKSVDKLLKEMIVDYLYKQKE